MRELAYIQKNNNSYSYQLINSTQGIDLMPFVFKKSLSYSKFERTVDNKFSSNTMNFTLKFDYEVKEVFFKSEKLMYISSDLLKGYNLDSFTTTISEAPTVERYILLDDVIKSGDEIYLEDEYRGIFTGIAESTNFKRDNTGIYIDVSIKDKTNTLYEVTYLKSYMYRDIYLSNNLDKENSLLHQLGYLLGFEDSELDIDDVKDNTNKYIRIPFVYLKKDELIIQDLAEAVRVTNSLYTIINNKLTIRLNENRLTETYVFDKRNILRELNKDTIIFDYEKIKVTYDRYFKKDLQDMWILQGENGTADNANIKILAGDTRRFNIKWFYNVSVVDNYEVYDVLISDLAGNAIEFKYDLSLNETGGILEFKNTSAIDLYVESFKIRGIPLFMQSDNESYYPANINSEKVLQLSNKFVQNYALAKLYSHIHYIDKCRSYRKFKFSTTVANFLETGVRIYFEHEDYKGYVIIERISFKGGRFEVEVREELEQLSISDLEYSEKTFVDEGEILSKKYLEENGLYEKDKPLVPKSLILTAQFLGFDIEFEESLNNLRGHYIYLRRQGEIDFSRYFINTNKYFFETTERVTFEVKVSSISINGVEGDTTEVKEVTPLKLNDSSIEYPVGLSPSEIDAKVGINASDIGILDGISSQLVTQVSSNEENITTNKTAINQNALGITSVVQEVQKKTTTTEVETITNTAIESFKANEFKRTLGTKISKIDYSKFISDDSLVGLNIDDVELEEVMITDYYSSIYQNSKEVMIAVKRDNVVSSINQTAEEIKINAKRIEIGSGLVVEGDKVALGEVTAENIRAGSISADKLDIGKNFSVDIDGNMRVEKVEASAIEAGEINGTAGNPIVLGTDTKIKGDVELGSGKALTLGTTVKIGENARGTGKHGILVQNGGLEVRNSQGTAIIDGTSNMFKIHQTGTMQVAGKSIGSVKFPALPYNPSLMAFFLGNNGETANKCVQLYYIYFDPNVEWGAWAYTSKDTLYIHNFFSTAKTFRYYVLKEEGI